MSERDLEKYRQFCVEEMDSSRMKLKNIHGDVMAKVKLSEEQLKFYWDNGFLVLKELIDFSTLYSCKQKFLRICNGVEDRGNIMVVKEISLIGKEKGERLINKVQDILYDNIFSLYSENPVLLDVVSQLLDSEDLVAINSMFINKPPRTTRHPTHQDLYYFPYRPADKMIATWTAIDDATKANGCLYVIPGSHKCGVIHDHGYPQKKGDIVNSMYHGILDESDLLSNQTAVDLEMSPGDTVFFHPLLCHGSGTNNTENYRKSITVHYASDKHCRPVDISGTNQQLLVSEIEGVTKRMGLNISFLDVWRGKSKGVRGVRSHL